MASNFSVPFPSPKSKADDYAKAIYEIYKQHWTTLENKRQAAIEMIDDRHRETEQRMLARVNSQKARINEHYNSIRPMLEEKCRENLELATAYHGARQDDLFKELQAACLSLTMQVATLEIVKVDLECPRVMIKEEILEANASEMNSRARRRQRRQNNNGTESVTTTNAGSQPNSPITNPKQTAYVFIENVYLS